jgi:hypothetical protein
VFRSALRPEHAEEFCVRELKPVLLQGMMRQTLPKDKSASVVHPELAQPLP